jgi:hypothetical protein
MRTPWVFNNYQFPVNPEEDSGWVYETIINDRVPIGGLRSRIQHGGVKSPRRQISGWMIGGEAQTFYNNMSNWIRNRVISNLVDHNGVTRQSILIEFRPQAVLSPVEWSKGRPVYRYNATFIALD